MFGFGRTQAHQFRNRHFAAVDCKLHGGERGDERDGQQHQRQEQHAKELPHGDDYSWGGALLSSVAPRAKTAYHQGHEGTRRKP